MAAHQCEDVYSTFNLLMRRKPKVSDAFVYPLWRCSDVAARRRQEGLHGFER